MSVLRAATSISAFTLLSRLLGFVRDMIMLRLCGAGWAMGTFILAWMAPNVLRRLVGEGALAAAFIPSYAAALDRDGKGAARRLLGSVTGVLLAGLCTLVAVVWVLCAVVPPQWLGNASEHGASAADSGALLVLLLAILFPYVVLICLVAVYNGALNALGVFGLPAALPVLLNVFWIAGLLVGAACYGDSITGITTVVAVFLLAGGVVQVAAAMAALARRGALPRPTWLGDGDGSRDVFARMTPTVVGMSMLQLNALLDHAFAYYLVEPGANTHVYMANRLLLFPHALTSLALATAVFPRLAVLASRADAERFRQSVGDAMRTTLFLAVPASVGLMLVAPDLVRVFFVDGEFGQSDGQQTALTTSILVAGLPFIGASQLYARALYAVGDMRSPARVAALLVPLNVVLNTLFVAGLGLGVPGLMVATGICAVLNAAILRRVFHARCGATGADWRGLARIVLATAGMAVAVWLTGHAAAGTDRVGAALLHVALPVALGIAVYAGLQWALGSLELRRLAAVLRRA